MRRLGVLAALLLAGGANALAGHTAAPTSVTIAGSLQSELGCPGDWQPDCAATHLAYDAADDVWQGTFTVPAGSWEYKAPLNGSWDENYGLHALRDGPNIPLSLASATSVKFYYDHKSHWITDNHNSVIAVAPGSFQSELGCPGDWQPDCLRSWLQDPDGDGTYTFSTTALPTGSYETKVALNESWDVNYGAGGVQNGPNIPFTVSAPGSTVAFAYNSSSHVLTVNVTAPESAPDNNVEWDGLRHDSRDTLYRTPGGAVRAGTNVLLRFRTLHNDVTSVKLRLYDLNASSQQILPMTRVASDVSCYQASLASRSCDFWQASVTRAQPDNLWYRFIVTDGTDTDYYADNTAALDGGFGAASDDPVDQSYALMVYDPAFTTPEWMRSAVIYQIFPDRFRNGNPRNDPKTGDVRYDDPVLKLPWTTKPEGYCRRYDDSATNCPWRFDTNPPAWSPTIEGPRGRDYMGGDLAGVTQKLDYLKDLGVTAIYFNPIFASKSNHGYDTADYRQISPYFGTFKDFKDLVDAAKARGMRIILDGVFNHMSSDSAFFDRYHHYQETGACESPASPWRSWFHFRPPSGTEPSACAPTNPGGNDTFYDGWFGFDSIPVLQKSNPDVQKYFVNGAGSIAKLWLDRGAAGWRLDVMGDSSFPNGYWETFRQTVKNADPDAAIIGELWQKDSTTLRYLRGDRADSTMNYRLRDAVVGLLAPQPFDGKGLGDSGRILSPSEAASRLVSTQEDYPRAVAYSLMNLLDSHDTERLLWQLTPGAQTTADKEDNAANVAGGTWRMQLAALIQATVPGAPTVYYGDEVGMTGDDDPDDRRTYPWADTTGGQDPTTGPFYSWYVKVLNLRRVKPALTDGDFRIASTDDTCGTLAYTRTIATQSAFVAVNRGDNTCTVELPEFLVRGASSMEPPVSVGTWILDGSRVRVGPHSGGVVLVTGDFIGTEAPTGLHLTAEGGGTASLAWNAVSGAASYAVYRSPVTGGGYVKAGDTTGTTFTDDGLRNARTYYYVVRALDTVGNESADSNEVSALPHLTIGWANTQWPPSMSHVISIQTRTGNVYGQVWIDGVTSVPGPTATLRAQLGFGPDGSNPAGNDAWTWVDASFNVDAGNNDEFVASMLPESTGRFDYAYRYTTTNGRDWLYADLDGIQNGYSPDQAGDLTVNGSGDTTAPATPTGLHVVNATPVSIDIAWEAVSGDPTLYGYEVLRDGKQVARLTGTAYSDVDVTEGQTYSYAVRAVDLSFNRSAPSAPVSATAQLRLVHATFNVTVPATTDATGRSVYIAGTLDRLTPPGPMWDPSGVVLTRLDATHWQIARDAYEGTQLEYKYVLGDWNYVEKGASCDELSNRQLTLAYGSTGAQTVNDTVLNWRNVAPCGNY